MSETYVTGRTCSSVVSNSGYLYLSTGAILHLISLDHNFSFTYCKMQRAAEFDGSKFLSPLEEKGSASSNGAATPLRPSTRRQGRAAWWKPPPLLLDGQNGP